VITVNENWCYLKQVWVAERLRNVPGVGTHAACAIALNDVWLDLDSTAHFVHEFPVVGIENEYSARSKDRAKSFECVDSRLSVGCVRDRVASAEDRVEPLGLEFGWKVCPRAGDDVRPIDSCGFEAVTGHGDHLCACIGGGDVEATSHKRCGIDANPARSVENARPQLK